MSKLSPLRPEEVIRRLRALGLSGPIPGGRHSRMVRASTGQIIPIPMHRGKDLSVGLIRAILREVDISPEEWNAL